MTENNIPTCERCGSYAMTYVNAAVQIEYRCPLDPKDCELKALRSEVEALRNDLSGVKFRAQELETKLRAAEDARKEAADAAVVLTEALEFYAEDVGWAKTERFIAGLPIALEGASPCESDAGFEARQALANTAALAAAQALDKKEG